MVGFELLWLPILLSAVFVFIASAIIHMLPLWHKNEFPQMANEEKFRDAVRPLNVAPGEYMVPRASQAEMRSPEFTEKLKKGPVMMMTVFPNRPFSMGKSLVQWFIYTIIVGICAAYISGRALPVGADYLHVFRFAGATAFFCYAVGLWQMSIWYGRNWATTIKITFDGLIFGLLTAGVFGWLWPR